MTIEQTIEIPENHLIQLAVPLEIPVGTTRVQLKFTPEQPGKQEIPKWLKGRVCEKTFAKGKILGDIIGPFHDEWENGVDCS
jgi:hypothetical protein